MTQPTKKKKGKFSRLSSLRFALLWTLTTGIAWSVVTSAYLLIEQVTWTVGNLSRDLWDVAPLWMVFIGGALLIGAIAGRGQQWLLQRRYGRRARHWAWVTAAAWGIGGLTFYTAMVYFSLGDWARSWRLIVQYTLTYLTLFVPIALVQMLFLRKHIKRAWLWIVAAVVSSATFSLPFLQVGISSTLWWVVSLGAAGVLQGSVMGFVMLWLWQMGAKPQDALPDDATQHDNQEAAERLREALDDMPVIGQVRRLNRDIIREAQNSMTSD